MRTHPVALGADSTPTPSEPGAAALETASDRHAPPILLVIPAASRPKATLQRAQVLAHKAGAALYIVVCLPKVARVNTLFPQMNLADAEEGIAEERLLARRIWRWCNRAVATTLEPEHVVTRRGSLAACATAEARRLNAQLVVVSANDLVAAADVSAIVEASGVSVLVARQARSKNRVVAATNLVFASLPVLRRGAALARSLGASLTFVHNVPRDPSLPNGKRGDRARAWRALDDTRIDRSSELLSWAMEDLGVDAESRVVEHSDTADAIVEMARQREADLVVVGHQRRSWVARLFERAVDEAVVNRSNRSVVVVPVDPSGVALHGAPPTATTSSAPVDGGVP